MKRFIYGIGLSILLFLGIAGTGQAVKVTLVKAGLPLLPNTAFTDDNSVVLTFSDEQVVIHDKSLSVRGKRLVSKDVPLSSLYLVRDNRRPSLKPGYTTVYSYGLYKVAIANDPRKLVTQRKITVWPITESLVVTEKPKSVQAAPDPTVQKVLALLNQDNILTYMDKLSNSPTLPTRYSCSQYVEKARDLIAGFFKNDAGLTADTTMKFVNTECASCSDQLANAYNVIAIKKGTKYPEQFYLVGAHYDSINTTKNDVVTCENAPGASDNASGVAGVLELARAFKGVTTESSVVFAAFGGEEIDLLGSKKYVQDLVDNGKTAELKGFVVLDMISYWKNDYGIYIEGSDKTEIQKAATYRLEQYVKTYTDLAVEINWKYALSDHVHFLNKPVEAPGGLLIQKECTFALYPQLHSARDTITHQKKEFALEVLKVAAALLAEAKVTLPAQNASHDGSTLSGD